MRIAAPSRNGVAIGCAGLALRAEALESGGARLAFTLLAADQGGTLAAEKETKI